MLGQPRKQFLIYFAKWIIQRLNLFRKAEMIVFGGIYSICLLHSWIGIHFFQLIILTMSIHNEGYSRDELCVLNYIYIHLFLLILHYIVIHLSCIQTEETVSVNHQSINPQINKHSIRRIPIRVIDEIWYAYLCKLFKKSLEMPKG